jgi:predicted amidohydrolase
MRVLLAELAPRRGAPEENLARLEGVLAGAKVDLAVFPELYLTGYAVGDRVHALALRPGAGIAQKLVELAKHHATDVVVGAPLAHAERPGEVENAALLVTREGALHVQVKRYLPTYGPFEEGQFYTPIDRSHPVPIAGRPAGLAICYDTFFPEVFRELALEGAELFAVVSASPVTSKRLFEKLLPARAIENAAPVLYANRVGVEDGIVFGGGSGAWNVRGEPIALESRPVEGGAAEERILEGEVDLEEPRRWRPFRPVLRDVHARPPRGRTSSATERSPT